MIEKFVVTILNRSGQPRTKLVVVSQSARKVRFLINGPLVTLFASTFHRMLYSVTLILYV
ncbi:hypothetical protein Ciccas_014391 [Cichlidogyrus casuarinus]|uniref:Uncharacterized protein n=1 Tax=Cichlidogyrus casuarinus TaxID=1844966 RepID=A0ABD2PIE1_9PLAT